MKIIIIHGRDDLHLVCPTCQMNSKDDNLNLHGTYLLYVQKGHMQIVISKKSKEKCVFYIRLQY